MGLRDYQEPAMDLFLLVSSIGTLILLATHLFDHASESIYEAADQQLPAVRQALPTARPSPPLDPVHYDQAA
jgi:hypothetical protein